MASVAYSPASPGKAPSSSKLHDADSRLLSRPTHQSHASSGNLQPSLAASIKARLAKAELKRGEWVGIGVVALLALVVRLWKIWEPSSVVCGSLL